MVEVAGAPLFILALYEVGLTQGDIPVVSTTRRDKSATSHWRLDHHLPFLISAPNFADRKNPAKMIQDRR